VFRPPAEYKSNQVYSQTPQALSSPMYGTKGSGGIDVGPASVLGSRFGGYADLVRDKVSQHWVTADLRATPSQVCAVSFTIARDGTVSNVQISHPSGNYLLDTSAKRAVMDANPLPPLPREVPQNDATVELRFQLPQ
jgi:protein TonB